jgi:hypothetical protein
MLSPAHGGAPPKISRPLHFKQMHPMCEAAEQGDLQLVNLLIAKHPHHVTATGEKDNSALAFACANGHADCCAALIRAGAKVNATSVEGNACLAAAVFANSTRCMRQLIEAKADINHQSHVTGCTALHIAVTVARAEALIWLISHGADRTLARLDGLTPLQLAGEKNYKECEHILWKADEDERAAEAKRRALKEAAVREAVSKELKLREAKAAAAAAELLAELEAEEAASGKSSAGGAGKGGRRKGQGEAEAARRAILVGAETEGGAGAAGEAGGGRKKRNKNKKKGKRGGGGGGGGDGGDGGGDEGGGGGGDEGGGDGSAGARLTIQQLLSDSFDPKDAAGDDDLESLDEDPKDAEDTSVLDKALLSRRTEAPRCPKCGSRCARTFKGECPACLPREKSIEASVAKLTEGIDLTGLTDSEKLSLERRIRVRAREMRYAPN